MDTTPTPTLTRFEIGQEVSARSACDYDCIFRFTVVSRTAKFVTFRYFDQLKKVAIREYRGVEYAYPLGLHSMAPSVYADRVAE